VTAAAARTSGAPPVSGRRVLVGLLLAIVGLGGVYWPLTWLAVSLAVAAFSLWEFARLAERKGAVLEFTVLLAASALYLVLTYIGRIREFEGTLLSVTVVGALLSATIRGQGKFFARSGYTVLGVMYIGKLLSYWVSLRMMPSGAALVVDAIVIVAMTDIAAMLVGVTIGRTPLTPISPKKTVEGAVGGLLVATGVSIAAGYLPQLGFVWWQGALVGLITSFAAQCGDLVESAFKRDAHVKDAGTIVAGHGGVLDRFDSFIFGGIAFYFGLWFLHVIGSRA